MIQLLYPAVILSRTFSVLYICVNVLEHSVFFSHIHEFVFSSRTFWNVLSLIVYKRAAQLLFRLSDIGVLYYMLVQLY